MRNDKGRQVVLSDDIRHCERLAASGNAHQCLEFPAGAHPFHEPFNSLRLVARRFILIIQFEYTHVN